MDANTGVPEVMECYLIRVPVPDGPARERFIFDERPKITGVAYVRFSFAMKQMK